MEPMGLLGIKDVKRTRCCQQSRSGNPDFESPIAYISWLTERSEAIEMFCMDRQWSLRLCSGPVALDVLRKP